MTENEQALTVWEHGVHIADREDSKYKYILYQVESFYVEVWYHKDFNLIKKFRGFASTYHLEPYLSNIKIKI